MGTVKGHVGPARLLAIVGLIVMAGLTSGCLDIVVRTKLAEDGSGRQTIQVSIERKFLALLNTAAQKERRGTLERQLQSSLPPGAKLLRRERNGTVTYSATIGFANVAELRRLRDTGPGGSRQRPFGLKTTRIVWRASPGLIVRQYSFTETLEPGFRGNTPEEAQLLKAFTMSYALDMPGRIVSSNADRSTDGRAYWKLSPVTGGTVTATSRVIRWTTIIWLAAAAATAVVVLALALLALLSRLR